MLRAALIACLVLGACGAPAKSKPESQPALVDVATASAQPVERVVRLLGQASAVDGIVLSSKASGLVTEIAFQNGSEVTAGQVLLRLDSAREAAAAREARGELDKAAKELANRKPLLDRSLVSQDEIDRLAAEVAAKQGALELAEATLADRTVLAPFSGSIGIRRIGVGSLVAPGTPIAPLARLDPMQVSFAVPEVHLAVLKPGLTVRATSPAYPGRSFTGTITAIDPGADESSRAVGAVALVPNQDRALRPGMALTVELVTERSEQAVTVPEVAVVMQGGTAFVWSVVDGKAVRTRVTTGVRMPGAVQILDGLVAGVPVVVQGLQGVRDGQPVQIRESAKTAAPKKP